MAGLKKVIVVGVVSVGALFAAPQASAVVHRVEHGGSGHYAAKASAAGYWTKARMKHAQPLDLNVPAPADSGGALRGSAPSGAGAGAGAGGFNAARTIAPQLPAQDSSTYSARRIKAPKYAAGPVPPQVYGTYPFSTNGKIFFRMGKQNYVCSGTSVASKSRSTVLTAGHCTHDRRAGWARNVAFVPAYWGGYTPLGIWPAKLEVAPRGWVRREHYSSDFAALKVAHSPQGALSRVVGGVGVAWGQPRKQTFYAVGYPGNLFNGEAMYACLSRSAGKDPFFRGPGQPDTGIGCNMGHGASGGGWTIIRRNHGKARHFLNSVTSYGYTSKPNLLCGPYFTMAVRNLVRSASRH
jgi:hypothetical protein